MMEVLITGRKIIQLLQENLNTCKKYVHINTNFPLKNIISYISLFPCYAYKATSLPY